MSTSKSHPQRHQEREIARAKRYAAQSGLLAFGSDSCKATMLKHLAHWHKSHDVTALHKAEWYRSQLVERDATKEATVHAQ
jgi:hypothetical protein